MAENNKPQSGAPSWKLPSESQKKDYIVAGRLVFVRSKDAPPLSDSEIQPQSPPGNKGSHDADHKLLGFPVVHDLHSIGRRANLEDPARILSLSELAQLAIEGLDYPAVMNEMADLGPEGRIALYFHGGKLECYQVFEEPRICEDIQRGGVIHNLEQRPQDMSGWRTHEFTIDSKGCLGEVCARCLRVCPENAIHLRGDGAGSFCEIDLSACKGCFICWVECSRKSADCIMIDGKVFDSELRSAHFGE
jgi:Pyruvate/2-oxoacid:ferredoxin oxidoreductase delta subunit